MLLADSNTGYACEEHVDILIDELVETMLFPPDIEKVATSENHCCGWCGKRATYRLSISITENHPGKEDSHED